MDQQLTALEQNNVDGSGYCVDVVVADRFPASTDPSTIAFAAMAGDAVAWSSPARTASDPSPVPSTLAVAQLQATYTCQDTNWDQVGGADAPIVPVLPQQGSGTRDTFLLVLGGGITLTPGACVVNDTNATGEIHQDTGLVVHAATTTTGGGVEQPTTTNASGQKVINRAFPAELQRTLYDVVRNGGTATAPAFPKTPSYEATALPALFGPSGWVCTNATAQADIVGYGFFNLGRGCGALTAGLSQETF